MTDQTCGRCGAEIRAHRSFCSQCGAPVGAAPADVAPVEPQPAPSRMPPSSEASGLDEAELDEAELDEAELNMTRVRPNRWSTSGSEGPSPIPAESPTGLEPPAVPASTTPPPPPPHPPVQPPMPPTTPPNPGVPGVGWTVGITFFFGIFGAIPASMHAARARKLGEVTGRYWKAFWITFAAAFVFWTVMSIVLVLAVFGAVKHAADESLSSYSSSFSSPSDESTYEPSAEPSYEDTYDTPSATPTQSFSGTAFAWTQKTQTGDATAVTLELGAPVAPADAPDVEGGTAQDALANCEIDEQRDLLIPFDLHLANSNDTLSQQVETHLDLTIPDNLEEGESYARIAFYSDNADCSTSGGYGDVLDVQSTVADDPGQGTDLGGYLILSQAVSPNFPQGDPKMLKASLQPLGVAPGDSTADSTSYSIGDGPWAGGAIPLSAGAS